MDSRQRPNLPFLVDGQGTVPHRIIGQISKSFQYYAQLRVRRRKISFRVVNQNALLQLLFGVEFLQLTT